MSKHGLTESIPSVYVTDPAGANRLLSLVHIGQVDSTNTACMNHMREPHNAGWYALWTDNQTAGRGRQGRSWQSRPGASLCLSVGRLMPAGVHAHPSLTVALGAALVAVLQRHGCHARLKWPNDIVLNGGKLGGILCEASSSGAGGASALVAGVGINLKHFETAPDEPASAAAAMLATAASALPKAFLQDAGLDLKADALALELAQSMTDILSVCHDAQALSAWCVQAAQHDAWRGLPLCVHERGQVVLEGVSAGVAPDGQYLLKTADGIRTLSVGELSLRRALPQASLLVDIGNTRLKWCVADADGNFITEVEHVSSHVHDDPAQLASLFARMRAVHVAGHDPGNTTGHAGGDAAETDDAMRSPFSSIRVARVGPHGWLTHFEAFAASLHIPLHVVESVRQHGPLQNLYAQPSQLGVDRFLGALAVAHSFSGRSAVIVSAGTATTIDAVDAQGHFLGGYILPGPQMMATALHRNTAQLPQVQADWAVFPRTTEEAIASGIVQAQAGAVRGMLSAVRQISEAAAHEPVLVLTGGAREWLRPAFEGATEREYLVLEGLARWQAD